jgi:predicted  nucleic acid-binding Zn-ribbon protein
MTDVLILFSDLDALNEKLKQITTELEDAGSRADALEEAIGDPYGRNDLREAVEDFEDRWNNRREDLAKDIKKLQEHVKGVLDGFSDWDTETAASMERSG